MALKPEELSRLAFETDGTAYLKICLDVTVYWIGPASMHRRGIEDFYAQSLALIRDTITFYRTETMRSGRRITAEVFDMLPSWLRQQTARDSMMMWLESGSAPDEPSDRAFRFHAATPENSGFVRLILPPSYISGGVTQFVDLARNLVREMDFASGHAGYAVNWNYLAESRAEASRAIWGLSQRYKGIDIPAPGISTLVVISKGIKCINWLTLLSSGLLSELGGPEAVRDALADAILLHDVPGGVWIQAGPEPRLGDVNRQERLPEYESVGRVLAPVRAEGHPAFLRERRTPNAEATEAWLSRFES